MFLRVYSVGLKSKNKKWTLFNDGEIRQFQDFAEVCEFMIELNTVPTFFIYERSNYVECKEQNEINPHLVDDDWIRLYLKAKDLE